MKALVEGELKTRSKISIRKNVHYEGTIKCVIRNSQLRDLVQSPDGPLVFVYCAHNCLLHELSIITKRKMRIGKPARQNHKF